MGSLFTEISPFYQTPNIQLHHTITLQDNPVQKKKKGKPGTRAYTKRRTDQEKIDDILAVIGKARWSLGEFLHKLFIEPDKGSVADGLSKPKPKVVRSDSHRHVVTKFLSGSTKYSPGDIVELMYRSKAARPPYSHPEARQYFSVDTAPSSIGYARPALSTWALELVVTQIIKESTYLSSEKSGLRVRASQKKSKGPKEDAPLVHEAQETADDSIAKTSVAPPLNEVQNNPHVLPSEDIDSGSEDEWDDIEETPPTQDGQVTELGADADEEDPMDVGKEDPMNVGEEAPLPAVEEALFDEGNTRAAASKSGASQQDLSTVTESGTLIPNGMGTTSNETRSDARTGASWNIVSNFSFKALRRTYLAHAPTIWHILWKFVAPKSVLKRRKLGARQYRPKWIVSNMQRSVR